MSRIPRLADLEKQLTKPYIARIKKLETDLIVLQTQVAELLHNQKVESGRITEIKPPVLKSGKDIE